MQPGLFSGLLSRTPGRAAHQHGKVPVDRMCISKSSRLKVNLHSEARPKRPGIAPAAFSVKNTVESGGVSVGVQVTDVSRRLKDMQPYWVSLPGALCSDRVATGAGAEDSSGRHDRFRKDSNLWSVERKRP
ncbi:hypothetical protein CRUP_017226 [Coryphaenoides rupestris]|nr:hypothetical protein CRUP_017226 [Coryphaenoides rupestris]